MLRHLLAFVLAFVLVAVGSAPLLADHWTRPRASRTPYGHFHRRPYPSHGWEYRYNRAEARSAGGYIRLFSI